MRFGCIFSALGATLICAGLNTGCPVATTLFLYAALSCLTLGLAYFLNRPQFLMKRANGRLHWLSWVLFTPYHLNNHLFLEVFRRSSRKPRWTEVVPSLWLGGRLRPGDAAKLFGAATSLSPQAGAGGDKNVAPPSILDVTAEFAEVPWLRQVPTYHCIPLLDTTAPSPGQLRAGLAFIAERLPHGPVYVHCAFGHSRSATFVIGHLLASGRCRTVDQAIAVVQARRPRVRLSPPQLAVLRKVFPAPPNTPSLQHSNTP